MKALHVCWYRDKWEEKQEQVRAEAAIEDAVNKDERFGRKVTYAMRRWHSTWQLMHAFQRWLIALRIRQVIAHISCHHCYSGCGQSGCMDIKGRR